METKLSKVFFTITIIFVYLLAHINSKASPSLCNGSAAECSSMVESEEITVIMESWSSQRLMEEKRRTISADAMKRNQPACNRGKGGESYTNNCIQPANKYQRGCTTIFRCERTPS